MTAPEAMMSAAAPNHDMGHDMGHDMRSPDPSPADSQELIVQTRFGPLGCSRQALVEMTQGPLGFVQHRQFALLDLPNPRLAQFRLLQSMADPQVSFVVVPTSRESCPIAGEDLDAACVAAGVKPSDALILLIVTVRPAPAGSTVTANLRAPIVLDVGRRTARQVVLPNPAYAIQHAL